jgi:hypothetical protein
MDIKGILYVYNMGIVAFEYRYNAGRIWVEYNIICYRRIVSVYYRIVEVFVFTVYCILVAICYGYDRSVLV